MCSTHNIESSPDLRAGRHREGSKHSATVCKGNSATNAANQSRQEFNWVGASPRTDAFAAVAAAMWV